MSRPPDRREQSDFRRTRRSHRSPRRSALAARPTRASCSSRSRTRIKRDSIDVMMTRLRSETAAIPGHSHPPAAGAEPRISPAAASRAPSTNIRCSQATSTRSTPRRRRWSGRWRKCPACATSTATCRSPIRNCASTSTATRRRPSASPPTRCAPRSTTPIGTRQISTIFTEADDYQVILEADASFQNDPARARPHSRRDCRDGEPRAARRSGDDARTVGPLQINRQSQQPAVTISFNLAPDMSLGQAIDAIHTLERKSICPPTSSPASPAMRNSSSRRWRVRARCCWRRC